MINETINGSLGTALIGHIAKRLYPKAIMPIWNAANEAINQTNHISLPHFIMFSPLKKLGN